MQSSATTPTLKSPFRDHVAHAFNTVYRTPYKGAEGKPEHGIARQIHGITHVTRAANYIYPLVNLYRYFGDDDACKLSPDDIELIKIAVLYHDAAREGEGTDLWDKQSAEMLYHYLTKTLKIPTEKATLLAEAVANKDAKWIPSKEKHKKNIYQKLIHDADCLDIIRARPSFDANHLDFYQQIGHQDDNAFEAMATLITEARSLINRQGDSYGDLDFSIKKQFEHSDAETAIKKTIHQNESSLLAIMQDRLLDKKTLDALLLKPAPDKKSSDTTQKLTEAIMQEKLRRGKVFARSIPLSSAIRKKESNTDDAKETKARPDETLAHVEIRKMMRRLGIATRTQKPNRTLKDGNPNRSISMIGWGAETYSDVGFLIVDPDITAISSVDNIDSNTGRLKKHHLDYKISAESARETQTKLDALLHQQKMGGASTTFFDNSKSAHNEILYTIKQFDAVYFSYDYNLFDSFSLTSRQSIHKYSQVLQAIYLQNEHYQMTKQQLPLFEYSGTHNFIKERHYSRDEIIQMWETMCCDYVQLQLDNGQYHCLSMSIEQIKTISMYQNATMNYAKRNDPADANYPDDLKHIINTRIESMRDKLAAKHQDDLLKQLITTPSILDSDTLYQGILQYPALAEHPPIKAKMLAEIDRKMSDEMYLKKVLPHEISQSLPGLSLSTEQYAELLTDKNAFLSQPSIASSYHRVMINRLFSLAKKMKLSHHVQTIQNHAKEAILHQLSDDDSLCQHHLTIDRIIELSMLFDCYADQKNLIMQSIAKGLTKLLYSKKQSGNYYLREIAIFAESLFQYHLISEEIKPLLMVAANRYGKLLASGPNSGLDLLWYLRIANYVTIPMSQQKKVTEAYIQHHEFLTYASNHYDIVGMQDAGLLRDDDLFHLVIKKIYYNSEHYSPYSALSSYEEYCDQFTYLFKEVTLNETQIECIEKAKRSVAEKCYVNVLYQLKGKTPSLYDLHIVILLGNAANMPLANIKTEIVTLLSDSKQCTPVYEGDTKFLNSLKQFSWLRDDAKLFEQWIAKFTSNEVDPFVKEIALFKCAMPTKTFSKMQSETIYRHAVKQFGETIAHQLIMPMDSIRGEHGLFAMKATAKNQEATPQADRGVGSQNKMGY